jgi:hypothetical protein
MERGSVPGSDSSRQILAGLYIERLRSHVSAVRPREGAGLYIHSHAREVIGIAQRLESTSPLASREIDIADGAVVEGQAQSLLAADLDTDGIV